ncbi:hypothetical protein [Streptomyces coryli]|uniref:hypothetical protein n=1 Tax=Streptomyces coryli TaxID=1128680 RepID=UPI0030B8E4B7
MHLLKEAGGDQRVDGLVDGLPGDAGAPGQRGDGRAVLVERGEQLHLRRRHCRQPLVRQGGEQPVLEPSPGRTQQLQQVALGFGHRILARRR